MTRPIQKQYERETLIKLLSTIQVQLDSQPLEGETPDFMIPMSGRTIGVEVTMYQSGRTVAGLPKRAIEAEWEEFETSSQIFQRENTELTNVYILFRFKDAIPPRRERDVFFREVLEFVRGTGCRIGNEYVDFWRGEITSSLMSKYLKDIVLRRCERGQWDSNMTAGFIAVPAETISRIVTEKSAKQYRPADELWLVIEGSHRPSEMILAIRGVSELNASPDLLENLTASPFSRVYAFTAMGLFRWDRNGAKWLRTID
jgi:hypothetical protein